MSFALEVLLHLVLKASDCLLLLLVHAELGILYLLLSGLLHLNVATLSTLEIALVLLVIAHLL